MSRNTDKKYTAAELEAMKQKGITPPINPKYAHLQERGFIADEEKSVQTSNEQAISEDEDSADEIIYVDGPSCSTPDNGKQPATAIPNMQLAMYNTVRGAEEMERQRLLAERIQGQKRSTVEDDSEIAFGDQYAERFGGPGTFPLPSAPPMTPEVESELRSWARASALERKKSPHHKEFNEFFENSGQDRRQYNPYLNRDELLQDRRREDFLNQLRETSHKLSEARGGAADEIDVAMRSLLGQMPLAKDFASVGTVYIPPQLLEEHSEDRSAAYHRLLRDSQYDQVQAMVNYSTAKLKSNWVWGDKVAGGTLEVRMTAERNKMVLIGEGYAVRNFGGSEGWATIARGIPKDTEYYHIPNEFTITRIMPGHIGLIQYAGISREVMRLLPGRYVLNERICRYIGSAKIHPNENVSFTPHAYCKD